MLSQFTHGISFGMKPPHHSSPNSTGIVAEIAHQCAAHHVKWWGFVKPMGAWSFKTSRCFGRQPFPDIHKSSQANFFCKALCGAASCASQMVDLSHRRDQRKLPFQGWHSCSCLTVPCPEVWSRLSRCKSALPGLTQSLGWKEFDIARQNEVYAHICNLLCGKPCHSVRTYMIWTKHCRASISCPSSETSTAFSLQARGCTLNLSLPAGNGLCCSAGPGFFGLLPAAVLARVVLSCAMATVSVWSPYFLKRI